MEALAELPARPPSPLERRGRTSSGARSFGRLDRLDDPHTRTVAIVVALEPSPSPRYRRGVTLDHSTVEAKLEAAFERFLHVFARYGGHHYYGWDDYPDPRNYNGPQQRGSLSMGFSGVSAGCARRRSLAVVGSAGGGGHVSEQPRGVRPPTPRTPHGLARPIGGRLLRERSHDGLRDQAP